MRDAWTWVAWLDTGEVVRESEVGTFQAVDVTRCRAIELQPVGLRRLLTSSLRVEIPSGAHARCFRRRRITVTLDGGPTRPSQSLTVVGCEGRYLVADDHGRTRWVEGLDEV